MDKKILHHSRYQPNAMGHGGERRTTQIVEYYTQQGYEIVPLHLNFKKRYTLISLVKAFFIIYKVYGLTDWKSVNKFRKYWRDIARLIPQLENYFAQNIKTFVWESVHDEYYYIAHFAQKYHKEIVAFPHNIESLVLNQKSALTNKLSPYGFEKDINILKKCELVNTISRFDTQLLSMFGINADFFPYNPPKKATDFLLDIKAKRSERIKSPTKQILILGTAHNPPTRIGMEKLIQILNSFDDNKIQVTLAGFGTEKLKSIIKKDFIVVKGQLSQTDLETEMINCDALLVNQPPTTGALTRVTEFLLAGIPVILNIESAHSHFEMEGVVVYENEKLFEGINLR